MKFLSLVAAVLMASVGAYGAQPDQAASNQNLAEVSIPQAPSATAAASSSLRASASNLTPSLSSALPGTNMIAAVTPHETGENALHHRFFDKKNVTAFAVHAGVRAADAAQSCVLLGRSGRQESWLPTKSCGAITAYSMTMVASQILTSYGLHRSGYHRLERWLPYAWAAPSAAGIAVSIRAW